MSFFTDFLIGAGVTYFGAGLLQKQSQHELDETYKVWAEAGGMSVAQAKKEIAALQAEHDRLQAEKPKLTFWQQVKLERENIERKRAEKKRQKSDAEFLKARMRAEQ